MLGSSSKGYIQSHQKLISFLDSQLKFYENVLDTNYIHISRDLYLPIYF